MMVGFMSGVGEREQNLRDFLTQYDRQTQYLLDRPNWYRIVACLDAIGDTDTALNAFLDKHQREGAGEWYLAIYGVLQVLFVQQDAIDHLARALNLTPCEPNSTLNDLRKLRSDAIGHPTARGNRDNPTSFTAISRVSLSREGFDMLKTMCSTDEHEVQHVELPDRIRSQQAFVEACLSTMLMQLQERETKPR